MSTRRSFLRFVLAGFVGILVAAKGWVFPETTWILKITQASAVNCTPIIVSPCWPFGGCQFISSPNGQEVCECCVGPACHDICCSTPERYDGCFVESNCCDDGTGFCDWNCCFCGCGCP